MADDLTSLSEIHKENLVATLEQRYKQDSIYTYIGDILIALNPYRDLPLYGGEKRQQYTDVLRKEDLPPHIYVISDRAYRNLRNTGCKQCCVVSGESGAGKTESTKLLVEHIASLCKHDDSKLHEKIVAVNPLLEAFGNAQTVINDNSSRFGKFIELVFDVDGLIVGAKLSEYLLEKSRLVSHTSGEKNFHIFYYFFAGMAPEKLKGNLLSTPDKHRIMMELDGGLVYKDEEKRKECKRMWAIIQSLLVQVGFGDEDITGIEAILTAIVHISDIRFLAHVDSEGVSIDNDEAILLVSHLLAVDAEKLIESLIITTSSVNREEIKSLKSQSQANDCRDALSKALYGRMFSWIVMHINKLLAPSLSRQRVDELDWIGILDIYGFENFHKNSFEQLCINVANEQLQLFFNQHIFKLELKEYAAEGIDGRAVAFDDNKDLLDLFLEMKDPPGVFALLDEETKFPKATDQSLIDKLNNNFRKHPKFESTKGQSLNFTIKHFAGPVTYNVEGFLEKNRDTLSTNVSDCLQASEALLVNHLFSPYTEIGGALYENTRTSRRNLRMSLMVVPGTVNRRKKVSSDDVRKRASRLMEPNKENKSVMRQQESNAYSSVKVSKTLATSFSSSLCGLIAKMMTAQPHFIRCIKPNAHKRAEAFEEAVVLQQLNYSGVLETIEIRKQGYAIRIPFDDFIHRYGIINGVMGSKEGEDKRELCNKVMQRSHLSDWKIGKSKVFLKHYHVEKLDVLCSEASKGIVVCQSVWRGALARKQLLQLRQAAAVYQQQAAQLSDSVKHHGDLLMSELLQCNGEDRLKKEGEPRMMSNLAKMTAQATAIKVERRPKKTVTPEFRKEFFELQAVEAAVSQEPGLPSIYESLEDSTNDPVFVFLQESLRKVSSLSWEIWGKLYFMEKNAIIGKVYVKDEQILINDSAQTYTGSTIGLNSPSFEHLDCDDVKKTINNIGQGVTISRDKHSNIYVSKHTDSNVYINGSNDMDKHCFPPSVNRRNSKISEQTKVFDIEVFERKVVAELKKATPNISKLVAYSCFSFSFGRKNSRQLELPVWICVINISALDMLGKEEVYRRFLDKGLLNSNSVIENLWSQLDLRRPTHAQNSNLTF